MQQETKSPTPKTLACRPQKQSHPNLLSATNITTEQWPHEQQTFHITGNSHNNQFLVSSLSLCLCAPICLLLCFSLCLSVCAPICLLLSTSVPICVCVPIRMCMPAWQCVPASLWVHVCIYVPLWSLPPSLPPSHACIDWITICRQILFKRWTTNSSTTGTQIHLISRTLKKSFFNPSL